jgi:hypothetical protein
VTSTNWPVLLYKFDTVSTRKATMLVFKYLEGGLTCNGAVRDGEKPGLRGGRS